MCINNTDINLHVFCPLRPWYTATEDGSGSTRGTSVSSPTTWRRSGRPFSPLCLVCSIACTTRWGEVCFAGLGLSELCLDSLRFRGFMCEVLRILSSTAKQITVITTRKDCCLSRRSSAKRTHRWSAGCSTLLLREKAQRSAGGSSAATASGTKFSSVRYRWRYVLAVLATH